MELIGNYFEIDYKIENGRHERLIGSYTCAEEALESMQKTFEKLGKKIIIRSIIRLENKLKAAY